MSKCSISKCDNDTFKNVETKIVDPNNGTVETTSVRLCKVHYDRVMNSSALNQSTAFSISGVHNGKGS